VKKGDMVFGPRFDIATVDLSFISAREVLPAVKSALKDDGILVLLVKPQFEATKAESDRGAGVIVDSAVHKRVNDEMTEFVRQLGCEILGVIDSPIHGHDGNREFLMVAKCARVAS
jgi:23S rRNA (cytidine1920-2'-O)/16S rRNA (cytidine1409-2'-O)-methyltransferase